MSTAAHLHLVDDDPDSLRDDQDTNSVNARRFDLLSSLDDPNLRSIGELSKDDKDAVSWFKSYNCPRYLLADVDRLIVATDHAREDALDLLLERGIAQLNAADDAQLWIELREKLTAKGHTEYDDSEDFDLIDGFSEEFRFTVNLKHTKSSTLNTRLTTATKSQLSALSRRIGSQMSVLGQVLIMAALKSQDGVINGDHMRWTVNEFYGKLQKRVYVLAVLADALDLKLSVEARDVVEAALASRVLAKLSPQPGMGWMSDYAKAFRGHVLGEVAKVREGRLCKP